MSTPVVETRNLSITKDANINLRSILTCNRSYFADGTNPDGSPRGVLLTDIVVWKFTLVFTGLPSNLWKSADVPPRYRLGLVRLYYREAICASEFITQEKQEFGTYIYAFDAPYQAPTYQIGNFPIRDYFPGYGSAIDTATLSADRVIVNLSDPNVQCTLVLHTYFNPYIWSYFF